MDLIKGLLGFIFKLLVIGLALFTVLIVVIGFLLKRDVDEIKEFTESLKEKV
ncbi:hypothetical protein [Corticicoccus populi]|uniref:Uncharacterized protein n=1 Tax=Corticicoccus populi TaxID=1812821 RepID=A0ABW5WZB2_9STAP